MVDLLQVGPDSDAEAKPPRRWMMVGVWMTLAAALATFAAALISYWPE